MASNASIEFFIRFVQEKHTKLISEIDKLVKALVSENANEKIAAAKSAAATAGDLSSAMSVADQPEWLIKTTTSLQHFQNGGITTQGLMTQIIKNYADLISHQWEIESHENNFFDFDAIFNHYKSQSRLSELFDEIIHILETIHKSNGIDSVSMIRALEKVIETLKQNKNGSYFSLNSAWSFLISFIKNYMWSELKKIPMLGTAMEALEKTIEETNEEMFKVHLSVEKEMERMVESEVKGLTMKTEFKFLGYDKSGMQLHHSKNSNNLIEKI